MQIYLLTSFLQVLMVLSKNEISILPKKANITPVFKKGGRNSKDNYRPVITTFQQCIFCQLYTFMLEFLSKYQCRFCEGYCMQHCLLVMLEKWKSAADKGKSFGALLADLSKAFDSLSHELLLDKLHAYGFSIAALRLTHSYLANRKQRPKVNLPYSPCEEILFGVPQGSIL